MREFYFLWETNFSCFNKRLVFAFPNLHNGNVERRTAVDLIDYKTIV